ncbi:MAG: hypothetical protein L0H65_02665, partial [Pseudorhodobacter sp.]|nr:hypothetical protein [Pseudorhodobacter sp.]
MGLFGLLSALFAGVMADGILASSKHGEDGEAPETSEDSMDPTEPSGAEPDSVDLLDIAAQDQLSVSESAVDTPVDDPNDDHSQTESSDTPPPFADGLLLEGQSSDDILAGEGGDDTIF